MARGAIHAQAAPPTRRHAADTAPQSNARMAGAEASGPPSGTRHRTRTASWPSLKKYCTQVKPTPPAGATASRAARAAGWSACFIGAMSLAASKMKVALPAGVAVDAEVDLWMIGDGYFLQAQLDISLPGLPREVAEALVGTAHQTCPYSKLTHGNINVTINLA